MGIISLTVTCGLLVASHWRREATKYARWIAFTGRWYSEMGYLLRSDLEWKTWVSPHQCVCYSAVSVLNCE
ncbi:mCG126886, isoform CRA_c [Mus musculus]|nr:mCG126886, isoform CRA_c [Mus musculus]